MSIAQLRSPDRDNGLIARNLWMLSKVLEADTFGTYQKEADDMRIRAEIARQKLTSSGEGALVTSDGVLSLDEDGNIDPAEEEDTYDALVPGYFR
jgi:hypothetical protein